MKTRLSLLALVFLTTNVTAEPLPANKVPATVRKGFADKFPDVKKVEWKFKSDKNYEAEFTLKGVEVAVKFNAKGKWLETETAIGQSALPKDVVATVEKEFQGYKIIETQTVERLGRKALLFELHLEKGAEVVKVLLEGSGQVVEKTVTKKKGN